MKVLHLLTSGETGGIESLCRDIGRYSKIENGFCFLTSGGCVCRQMKEDGIQVYELYEFGGKLSIRKIKKLRRIASDYDVITVHHGDPFLKIYFIILSIILKKRMISIIHSCYDEMHFKGYGKTKRKLTDLIFQRSLLNSDEIVYVSEAGKKSYESYFKEINKIKNTVVYNGIADSFLSRGMEHVYTANEPYNITYIGRLSEIKGIDYLIKAVALLRNEWDLRLTIVGDGIYRKNLEQQVKQNEIGDITRFEGQQLNVTPYLEKTTLFVYPSICMEVFGISLVEAMAYGVPCLGSNIGGIPEVINNYDCGCLVKPGDSTDLAKNIDHLLKRIKEGTIESMVMASKERARHFTISNTIRNLEKVFEG